MIRTGKDSMDLKTIFDKVLQVGYDHRYFLEKRERTENSICGCDSKDKNYLKVFKPLCSK
jgi:hypothetical protein